MPDHPHAADDAAAAVRRRHHVTEAGDGTRPMLFAHGFGCDQRMWRLVAPAFERDHRVILFDYVGSGRSDVAAWTPARYGSLAGYAQDVVDVVEALDLRDVVFVGHSVSSMIGVLAAARVPDRFARLVLVGPSPRYVDEPPAYVGGWQRADLEALLDTMDRNYLGWAASLAPAVAGPGRPEVTAEFEASFCSTDPAIARRFAEATFLGDNRADLASVRVPTLVIQTSEDVIAPPVVGEYVHRAIPGSTLRVLEAAGHAPHLTHPAATIAAIRAFLDDGATRA